MKGRPWFNSVERFKSTVFGFELRIQRLLVRIPIEPPSPSNEWNNLKSYRNRDLAFVGSWFVSLPAETPEKIDALVAPVELHQIAPEIDLEAILESDKPPHMGV